MSAGGGAFGHPPQSHHPPSRDAQSVKYVLYGPGHEKFPSWPMAAATEVPVAVRAPPTGGSQRSKSWTDHTNYPKEQIVAYTRPYMKRSNSSHPQQLRTVPERCEKKNFDSMQYMQNMDRRKNNNSSDFNNPPFPERDLQKRDISKMGYRAFSKESITPLTQADLEEYTKKFEESTHIQHQKQSSYAQSEGYHSYVSSSDSSSTPFIDSLRRDIDASVASISRVSSWDGESIVTTRSGSVSSSETLKWHGSLSDMSDVSNSSGTSPRQLIVHSARVQTPQKQNSESVLYMARSGTLPDRPLPHRTISYTLPSQRFLQQNANPMYPSPVPPRKTVAECINIYEGKNIKAIQKKALLSFYERHQDQMKKDAKLSDGGLQFHNASLQNNNELPMPKNNQLADNHVKPPIVTCDSPNSIFQGPVIMGPSISLDEWVPERPPKNRNLIIGQANQDNQMRNELSNKPRRLPSPELPLPSPPLPASDDDIMYKCDDPFPPPPEKIKEPYQYPPRSSESYGPQCEPQVMQSCPKEDIDIMSSTQKLREISVQSYAKPAVAVSRKFVNPYIKSTGYGYDLQQKSECVPQKITPPHSSIKIECEVQHNKNRHDSFNKLPQNNEIKGQFRAEPLGHIKTDIDSKNMPRNKETLASANCKSNLKSENINRSNEIVGHFRAEPLTVQPVYFVQNQYAMNNEKVGREMKINPPKVSPKVQRSNSESNRGQIVRDIPMRSPSTYNNFSKSAAHNQSMKRFYNQEIAKNNHQYYGRQSNQLMKDNQCDRGVYNNNQMNFIKPKPDLNNEIMAADEIPVKEEKPPLPEKKSVAKVAEIQKVNQLSPPIKNNLQAEPKTPEVTQNESSEHLTKKIEEKIESKEINNQIVNSKFEKAVINHVVDTSQKDTSNTTDKLQPREYLPEENKWEYMRIILVRCLLNKHPIQVLLSEFDECDKTAQQIVDVFAVDTNQLEENKISENDMIPEKLEKTEANNKVTDSSKTNENPKEIYEWNLTSDKENIEKCLQALIKALEDQASVFETKMNTNEELGTSIVDALEKPYSTRVSRLMTDIGLITSLISSLTSMFNRISKNLRDLPPNHQNKTMLESEKVRLMEKLEDARALKKSIDNSKLKLLAALKLELKDDLMDNCKYFINQKIKLVIYNRDVKDRIDIAKRLLTSINQEHYCPGD